MSPNPSPRLPRGPEPESKGGVGLPSVNPTKSYWLKELSPVLEGHRTTDELPGSADVVIVGSGVTGAFAGWFLKMGVDDSGFGSDEEDDSELDEKIEGNARAQESKGIGEEAGGIGEGGGCCGLKDAIAGLFRRVKGGEMVGKENNDKADDYRRCGDTSGSLSGTRGSWKGKEGAQSVVMLEAREVCSGATGRNGGHCQPLVYFSPSIAEFELETYHFLENFIKKHNISCDWISQSGVHTYLDQDIFDLAQDMIQQLKQTDPHLAAQLNVVKPSPESDTTTNQDKEDKGIKKETLSSLRIPHAKGAVLQQHAASVWPYKLIAWLLEQLLAKFPPEEFNLQTNTPVTSLRKLTPSDHLYSEASPNKWLVSTPGGDIIASKVILATNGYTAHLLPKMNDLIVPVRGQITSIIPPHLPSLPNRQEEQIQPKLRINKNKENPPNLLEHAYIFLASSKSPDHNTKDDHVIQRPSQQGVLGGELIFGGGRDFASPNYGVGIWQDDTIDENVSRYLRGHLSPPLDFNLGGAQEEGDLLEATHEWTGIMGFTRDHYPLVGEVPRGLLPGDGDADGGVWMCAGYNGHGMPVAPLAARAVVGRILGQGDGVRLPREFEITEERARVARSMGSVWDGMVVKEGTRRRC